MLWRRLSNHKYANGVATKDDAVALLQRAATHIRDTTVKVVAAKESMASPIWPERSGGVRHSVSQHPVFTTQEFVMVNFSSLPKAAG